MRSRNPFRLTATLCRSDRGWISWLLGLILGRGWESVIPNTRLWLLLVWKRGVSLQPSFAFTKESDFVGRMRMSTPHTTLCDTEERRVCWRMIIRPGPNIILRRIGPELSSLKSFYGALRA